METDEICTEKIIEKAKNETLAKEGWIWDTFEDLSGGFSNPNTGAKAVSFDGITHEFKILSPYTRFVGWSLYEDFEGMRDWVEEIVLMYEGQLATA